MPVTSEKQYYRNVTFSFQCWQIILNMLKSYYYVLFTASYFVNWTYQNPKSCTVVVGEPTEVFPAPKATSLEFANKTMARPHQSLPTIGTGKEEHHSRHRRSVDVVDGHASSLPQSISSDDSSTVVNMHDITKPSVNTVSLVHGVAEDITTQRDEDMDDVANNAFVSSNIDDVSANTGDLTKNNQGTSTTTTSNNPPIVLATVATSNNPPIASLAVGTNNNPPIELAAVGTSDTQIALAAVDSSNNPPVALSDGGTSENPPIVLTAVGTSNNSPTASAAVGTSNNPPITLVTVASTTAEQPALSAMETTTIATNTAEITTKVTNYVSTTTTTAPNIVKETHVEHPLEINEQVNTPAKTEKNKIAYEPENMQGDSFPLIRSYGLEKLQFFRIQNQLEQIKEVLHIYSNDSSDMNKNLEKFHYDSENSGSKTTSTTTSTSKIMTSEPVTISETPVTTKPTTQAPTTTSSTETPITNEHVTNNPIIKTTNMFTTHIEHVVTTTPSLNVTNDTLTTSSTTEATPDEVPTVNTVDTKLPDVSNPKHVLINLTISADNAESSSFKQLYSLTLTVPTLGDSNEIPTVKITPMDSEPTQASHFNKPVTLEGSTKFTNSTKDDNDIGGSCECSCPACISNATDDFYDDATENGATTESSKSDASTITDQISSTDQSDRTESTTKDLNKSGTTESETVTSTDSTAEITTEISTTTDNISTTDSIEFTTDSTTEEEILTTTESPKCVCPKILPPPILILEGEVDLQ